MSSYFITLVWYSYFIRTHMSTPLSQELTDRGFIHQHTAASLAALVDGEPQTIYHGIDPTADSATLGNMVVWLLLRHLAQAGHKIIFLVGGGTGMIGDPKPDAERTLQTPEQVAHNVAGIKAQAERLVGAGTASVQFVNNQDWLLTTDLITFLRDIGKHFTVNELIKKDAIATRLAGETGISYTEFAYPLLQAFDYLTLYKMYNCTIQVGGSDQWGNIVSGVELVRCKEQVSVHALTTPLIIDKATGKKFGKSEGNAVWLSPEKTSPFAFYQFWLQVPDEGVIEYLKIFTLLPLAEIADIEQASRQDPAARLAQKRLAAAVTEFVHGVDTAQAVANVSATLFEQRAVDQLSANELQVLKENAPYFEMMSGIDICTLLVETRLATSKREARTFIEAGAVSVQEQKVAATTEEITQALHGEVIIVRRGKKHVAVVALK